MKIALFIATLAITFSSNAQIIIDSVESQYLPAYNFFGSNYIVSNVNYIGHWKSYGQFDGSNSNLGLDKGFVINTGDRDAAIGPNNSPDAGADVDIHGSSPFLDQLSIHPRLDGVTLSCDIVPLVDTLRFRFVFASEEYLEYVGSTFNDVVGIFIEGPGFSGPTNIGTLPNGNKISVNEVHPAVNNQFGSTPASFEEYYVDNPESTDPTKIGYDGFTQGTYAFVQGLEIDSTYTLTFSIADVADGLYDAALFVEACETCNYTLDAPEVSESTLSMYPNPVLDVLHVQSTGQQSYEIVDGLGQVVRKGDINGAATIDCSNLSSGVYVFRTNSGVVHRIQKQ
ncbi:MAG: choice-of-anchor L domain-containing protein [Fluviicola sp.]